MKARMTLVLVGLLAACTSQDFHPVPANSVQGFQPYSPQLPNYRVYPGDKLDITFYSAPELSRSVTVGPDGRIHLPLISPVMVADQTVDQIRANLMNQMSTTLVDPSLDTVISEYGPQQAFVGGEVNQPGVIQLPGQIDALQAVIMAGGFTVDARERQVFLVRRSPSGEINSYSINVRAGWNNPQIAQLGPLQRFDVIYVPKSRIAQHNQFIQQYIREALPIDFSFVYDLSGNRRY